jgi:hypothetical protein
MSNNAFEEAFWKPSGKLQQPLSGVVRVRQYLTPFEYANVQVWNPEGAEGLGPHPHGYEMARNEGTITVTEPEPIIAVAVIGSGCIAPGYVFCEYLQEGEPTAQSNAKVEGHRGYNLQNIRMQRIGDLWSMHPSAFLHTRDYQEIVRGYGPRSPINELMTRESTAYFEIEATRRIVLRGGSGDHDHFAFRIIRTYVLE